MVSHGFQVVRNGFRNHPQYQQGRGLRSAHTWPPCGSYAAYQKVGLTPPLPESTKLNKERRKIMESLHGVITHGSLHEKDHN